MNTIKYYQAYGDARMSFISVWPIELSGRYFDRNQAEKKLESLLDEKVDGWYMIEGKNKNWKVRNLRIEEFEMDIEFEDGKLIPSQK
jgi:hypothetical protein